MLEIEKATCLLYTVSTLIMNDEPALILPLGNGISRGVTDLIERSGTVGDAVLGQHTPASLAKTLLSTVLETVLADGLSDDIRSLIKRAMKANATILSIAEIEDLVAENVRELREAALRAANTLDHYIKEMEGKWK